MSDNEGAIRGSFPDITRNGFLPLTMEQRELVEDFTNKTEGRLSSYCHFSTMSAWLDWTKVYYKEIGAYLCFLCRDGMEDRWYALPPFGSYEKKNKTELKRAVSGLYEAAEGQQRIVRIEQVKDFMLPRFYEMEEFSFQVSYDRNKSDYLYRRKDFTAAQSKPDAAYDIRHLLKYQKPSVKEFSRENMGDCFWLLEQVWCRSHNCAECSGGCQKKALLYFLMNRRELGLFGFIVYSVEKPIGYSGLVRAEKDVIFQMKKNVHGIRGLTEYMHREAVARYCQDCEFVNYTEDMGRQGLRYYKEHLAPYTLSHNYVLTRGDAV